MKPGQPKTKKGRTIITQKEIAYRDYNIVTGELIRTGSEDFSREREKTEILHKWAWTWDGQKLNKGGFRWFDNRGYFQFRKSEKKEAAAFFKNKYDAELIQFR